MIECRYMSVEIMSVIHVSSKSMIIAVCIWVAISVVEIMAVSVVTKFMVVVAKVVIIVTPSVSVAKVVVIMA